MASEDWSEWAKAVLTYIEDDKKWKEKYGEKVELILRRLAVFDNELTHIAKEAGERAGRKWGIISGIGVGIFCGLIMLGLKYLIR